MFKFARRPEACVLLETVLNLTDFCVSHMSICPEVAGGDFAAWSLSTLAT